MFIGKYLLEVWLRAIVKLVESVIGFRYYKFAEMAINLLKQIINYNINHFYN